MGRFGGSPGNRITPSREDGPVYRLSFWFLTAVIVGCALLSVVLFAALAGVYLFILLAILMW